MKKEQQCGSWILTDKKTLTAAIESILLLCRFMDDIGVEKVIVDARKDHPVTLKFIRKISHGFHSEDETNLYYVVNVKEMVTSFYKRNEKYVIS